MSNLRQIREARGLTGAQLAAALNTTAASVSRYETQDQRLTLPLLRRLAKKLNTSISEIAGERPPVNGMSSETALIRGYDLRLSAGPGALVADEDPAFAQPFRLDWLKSLTRAPTDKLALLLVSGDSMEPTLRDGDQTLVDLTQNRARDGVFAIRMGADDLLVKRVSVSPTKPHLLTISSDNPLHKTYDRVDPADVAVIGRVIWIGRKI